MKVIQNFVIQTVRYQEICCSNFKNSIVQCVQYICHTVVYVSGYFSNHSQLVQDCLGGSLGCIQSSQDNDWDPQNNHLHIQISSFDKYL